MRVLVACEFSGIVREAFRRRGHDAWSCDLLPTEIPGQHIQANVIHVLAGAIGPNDFDLMIAHPPCTHLTARGRYRANDILKREAEQFFMLIVKAPIRHIAVENPKCVMSTLYRKPDQIIHPHQFGHRERKATCLWLKNLPLLRHTEIVAPEEPVHVDAGSGKRRYTLDYLPGNADRWKIRSRTFPGIAEAMAAQWGSIGTSIIREAV